MDYIPLSGGVRVMAGQNETCWFLTSVALHCAVSHISTSGSFTERSPAAETALGPVADQTERRSDLNIALVFVDNSHLLPNLGCTILFDKHSRKLFSVQTICQKPLRFIS